MFGVCYIVNTVTRGSLSCETSQQPGRSALFLLIERRVKVTLTGRHSLPPSGCHPPTQPHAAQAPLSVEFRESEDGVSLS